MIYGFRFSIEKLGSAAYAQQAWKTFWSIVKPSDLAGASLSTATVVGTESIYVIYIQGDDPAKLARVAEKFGSDRRFLAVAVEPAVATETEGTPPVEAGNVTPEGEFRGGSWAEAGLLEARRSPMHAPSVESPRRRRWMLWAAAAFAFVLVAGVTTFFLIRSRETASDRKPSSARPSTPAPTPTEPATSPTPSPTPAPVDTLNINTAAGVLKIEKVKLSDSYMDCPPEGGTCKDVKGPPYLVVSTRSVEGKSAQQVTDAIILQAGQSFVTDSANKRADFAETRSTGGSRTVEIIYGEFDSTAVTGLVLFWPDNPPITLHPA